MIITRLLITLGGGGTELPSYYRDHGGFLVAAAIDKYVYVTAMRPFTKGSYLKYSKLEHVEATPEVQHAIMREAIKQHGAVRRAHARALGAQTSALAAAGS